MANTMKRATVAKRVVYGKFEGQPLSADVLTVQDGAQDLCSSKCRFLGEYWCRLLDQGLTRVVARKTDCFARCDACRKGER